MFKRVWEICYSWSSSRWLRTGKDKLLSQQLLNWMSNICAFGVICTPRLRYGFKFNDLHPKLSPVIDARIASPQCFPFRPCVTYIYIIQLRGATASCTMHSTCTRHKHYLLTKCMHYCVPWHIPLCKVTQIHNGSTRTQIHTAIPFSSIGNKLIMQYTWWIR